MNSIIKSPRRNSTYIIWVGVILSALILLVCYVLWPSRNGQFEGVYTIANTIFSGLAFVGLIIAILMQREDLKLQQQELSDTRDVFKEQNVTVELQRFENTFFNLLKSQSDIVRGIDIRKNVSKGDTAPAEISYQIIASGRDCFKTFHRNLLQRVSALNDKKWEEANPNGGTIVLEKGKKPVKVELEDTINLYLEVYKQYQGDLSHYFRNLYTIVRFVNDSELMIDKGKYMRLIRAQLSAYELVMLFYNCLGNYGSGKFKKYIEEYHLLKNLDWDLLITINDKRGYRAIAYGAQTKPSLIPNILNN